MSSRRRVTSGGAAFAAVLAAVLVWWLFSGNGPQGPDGNAQRLAVAEDPVPGSGGEPLPDGPADPDAVRIDRLELLDEGRRLQLTYLAGPARCAGPLETPRVVESDVAVTVTLTLERPAEPQEGCDDAEQPRSVRVDLDAPLGDRSVLDGYHRYPVRVTPDR